MIGVRTPIPPLCVYEFVMALSSLLCTKKNYYLKVIIEISVS